MGTTDQVAASDWGKRQDPMNAYFAFALGDFVVTRRGVVELTGGRAMPVTGWEDVAGYACQCCGGPATHIYGPAYFCCQCHAGPGSGLFSREEAEREHARVLIRRAEEGGE